MTADLLKILGGDISTISPWKPGDPTVLLIWGQSGAGKNHLAYTAPAPIIMYDFEHNGHETLRNFPDLEGNIVSRRYMVPPKDDSDMARGIAERFVTDFHSDLDKMKMNKITPTIFIDSITLCYDLITFGLVKYGPSGRAMPREYGKRNNEHLALFQKARAYKFPMILSARASAEWVNNEKTDRYKADVKEDTLFAASVVVEITTDPKYIDGKHQSNRMYHIRRCKVNEKLEGWSFPSLTYPHLMTMIETMKGE